MKVGQNLHVHCSVLGGDAAFQQPKLTLSTWTYVYISIEVRSDLSSGQCYLQIADSGATQTLTPISTSLPFSTYDVVRIGGTSTFIGGVSTLKVISPGVLNMLGISYILFILLLIFSFLSLSNCLGSCDSRVVLQTVMSNPTVNLLCGANQILTGSGCATCTPGTYQALQQNRCLGTSSLIHFVNLPTRLCSALHHMHLCHSVCGLGCEP